MFQPSMLDAERHDTLDVRDPSRFHGFMGAHPPRLRTGDALRGLAMVGGALCGVAFLLPPSPNLLAVAREGGGAVLQSAHLFALPAVAVLGLVLALLRGASPALGASRAFLLTAFGAWGLNSVLVHLASSAGAPGAISLAWGALLVAGVAMVARMHRPDHWTPRLLLVSAAAGSIWLAFAAAYGPAYFVPAELQAAVATRPDTLAGWLEVLPAASDRLLVAWHLAGLVLLAGTALLALARPDPLVDLTRSRVLPAAWLLVFYLPATAVVWWMASAAEHGVLAAPALARGKLALSTTAFALWIQFGAGALYHQLWTATERRLPRRRHASEFGPLRY